MPQILILSSHVAASRVGGGAQALALGKLGIDPILVPTVLFGRHPGWGAPGGRAVEAETMAAMLEGIEAQGLYPALDAVITGHFSTPEQVAVAAQALDAIRAVNPAAGIFVDPIMGDTGRGLYVKEAVAEALVAELLPRADLVAPNAWELGRLSGCEVESPASAVFAARVVRKPVLVSSVVAGDAIGAVYVDAVGAAYASHPARDSAPNGTGDLLTALFTAGLVLGFEPPQALATAVSGVADAVSAAEGQPELSVDAFPTDLGLSPDVALAAVDG
ncbi:MAG TPA: bifunctional hydroxymethylpyrimidine kinase/phosphomethylpyrimidine kinase [Caulobacteraceae bacterium]|nr:bifunctional hydroxymethylpyrimidine kinase/phosphomethylpyrimidine kinase [Caulobacteraceae bacterium]